MLCLVQCYSALLIHAERTFLLSYLSLSATYTNIWCEGRGPATSALCRPLVRTFTDFASLFNKFQYVLPPSPETFVGNYALIQYWPLINNLAKIFEKQGTLYLRIEWLVVPLSYVSPWVLVTGHFKRYPLGSCEDTFLSSGLSHLKYYFRRPSKPGGKSPGFHVYGLTTYGFANFKRV